MAGIAAAAVAAALVVTLVLGNAAANRLRGDVDARLLRTAEAAARAFDDEMAQLSRTARDLARDPVVARALEREDAAALDRVAAGVPGTSFWKGGRRLAGERGALAGARSAEVTSGGVTLGRVTVGLELGDALAERLEAAAAPAVPDRLLVAASGETFGDVPDRPIRLPRAGTANVGTGDRALRAVVLPLLRDRRDMRVAAVTPLAAVERAASERRRQVLLATGVTIVTLLAAAAAIALWRTDRTRAARRSRIELDRRNLREALSLVGDALAATHDSEALLPVITQTAMEAAGATEARLLRGEQEVLRTGRRSSSRAPLVLPLGEDEDGNALRVLIYTAGGTFPDDARELAEWFVSQASIALENARLHRIVRRQAVTDDLTGLANRRQFIAALESELARADRFDTELAVVIADLDDFKSVNDRFGHEFGNDVLRAFGEHLRTWSRDVDVAARLGGEEFALLLPQTDAEGAAAFADRLRDSLAGVELAAPDGTAVRVTASFGVSAYPRTRTIEELLHIADTALYRAKAAGKNRVVTG